jgi:hypothetical protein
LEAVKGSIGSGGTGDGDGDQGGDEDKPGGTKLERSKRKGGDKLAREETVVIGEKLDFTARS